MYCIIIIDSLIRGYLNCEEENMVEGKSPFIIAIAPVSGGRKTIITKVLNE